jgi:hypothetical protein
VLPVLPAGKVGAIVAGVVLAQVSNQAKFYISAICGLVGFIITIIFVPGACLLLGMIAFRLEPAVACMHHCGVHAAHQPGLPLQVAVKALCSDRGALARQTAREQLLSMLSSSPHASSSDVLSDSCVRYPGTTDIASLDLV